MDDPEKTYHEGLIELLGQLDWDPSFDYKAERSRRFPAMDELQWPQPDHE